jgi:O-methyltransferase involved in polyketide biosynthesis
MLAVATAATRARGEPQGTSFETAKLAEQVTKIGFTEVTVFGPDEVRARYFSGRTDSLRPSPLNHYMRALVGPRST